MPRAPKAPGHAPPGDTRTPWRNSNRRRRLPPNWDELRAAVRRRSGGRCEMVADGVRCHRPAKECDHIVPGDDHRPENLQDLCWPHHRKKSSREGGEAAARARRQR